MQNITVIGLGKLGLPLAQKLSLEYQVKAGARSIKPGRESIVYELGGIYPKELISPITILTIPPSGFSSFNLPLIPCERLIYTSSTSVYGDDLGLVTEETTPLVCDLLKIENWIKSHPEWIILRLAGLVGPERHPGKFLAGKTNLARPNAPVNLIHHDDVITAVQEVLKQNRKNEIFNIVSDEHRSRKEFYETYSKLHKLPLPQFSEEVDSSNKLVANDKMKRELGIKNFTSLL